MKKPVSVITCLVLLALFSPAQEAEPLESLTAMRNEADRVLGLSNVSTRSEIGVVFELVDRLIEEKKEGEAEKYLQQALKHNPWQLGYQMLYADLLTKRGAKDKAGEIAEMVHEYAEQQTLIQKSSELLGKTNSYDFAGISKIPGSDYCVVLVPMQGCEAWLLSALQSQIAGALKMPVYIQTISAKYPDYGRDARDGALNHLKKQLRLDASDPTVSSALKAVGVSIQELDNDDSALKVLKHIIEKQAGKEAVSVFEAQLDEAAGKLPQWNASELLSVLVAAVKPFKRNHVVYLGITNEDIYSGSYNFVFGSADPSGGVMSYRRFTAGFNGEIPNQKRLLKRTFMQGLSSIGHVVGVKRCSIPTCARAYPNSLAEHDAKEGALCSGCGAGFTRVLSQK